MVVNPDAGDIVIVGAGHAGANAAAMLRQFGHPGRILVLGAEMEPPYERPSLSKEYLTGERAFERMLQRSPEFWKTRAIDLHPGQQVTAIDPVAYQVMTAGGRTWSYRTLIWAAGGDARRLSYPGHDLGGIHTIRSRADVDKLRGDLPGISQAVIIGGGYIGLEVAAALRRLGKAVTVLEVQERLLARVAGADLSSFYTDQHRAHGVDVRLGARVAGIAGRAGHVSAVILDDGSEITADIVVAGIGIIPAVQPLRQAGAIGADGVDVDLFCRTSLPDILAIGDCAAQMNAYAGGSRMRIESVQNARDQAATAARHLTGHTSVAAGVPTFWSNQYDLRLQAAGLSTGHDQVIVQGNPADRSFSVLYLRDGRPIAVDSVNAPKDFTQSKAAIAATFVAAPSGAAP